MLIKENETAQKTNLRQYLKGGNLFLITKKFKLNCN